MVALAAAGARRRGLGVAGAARAPASAPTRCPRTSTGLRQEVAALRAEAGDALRHLAVVRYDAFGDMGGHLSWSLALLDDAGHGVVLTSIHGRSEARTYAKSISALDLRAAALPRGGGGDRARPPLIADPSLVDGVATPTRRLLTGSAPTRRS